MSNHRRVGQLVEDLTIQGFTGGQVLTAEERTDIVEFAITFEECQTTRAELEAMPDSELVGVTYWAMADYARGQM